MIRYALLYFILLIIFVALIAGPIVAGRFLGKLPKIPMQLLQPTGQNNNDTTNSQTGSALIGGSGPAATTSAFTFGRARLA